MLCPSLLTPGNRCGMGLSASLCPSPSDYLKEKLDAYMSQFPKVKVLHLSKRHGLIRARLAGAQVARGETEPGHSELPVWLSTAGGCRHTPNRATTPAHRHRADLPGLTRGVQRGLAGATAGARPPAPCQGGLSCHRGDQRQGHEVTQLGPSCCSTGKAFTLSVRMPVTRSCAS